MGKSWPGTTKDSNKNYWNYVFSVHSYTVNIFWLVLGLKGFQRTFSVSILINIISSLWKCDAWTEHQTRGSAAGAPVSYSWDAEFKYRPSWPEFFIIFLDTSSKLPVQNVPQIRTIDSFFILSNSLMANRPTIRDYVLIYRQIFNSQQNKLVKHLQL